VAAQALHRVRERLVSQRTGIINQIRAFMLERGIAVWRYEEQAMT
jgi:transposase